MTSVLLTLHSYVFPKDAKDCTASMNISPIPIFQDNYVWMIDDQSTALVVDPGDSAPVLQVLKAQKLELKAILLTHHHYDHVNGVAGLLEAYQVPVYGPSKEAQQWVTHPLADGMRLELESPDCHFLVMEVPGHTAAHIAFYNHEHLFCGDTLFSAGCGRLFEGSAEQLYTSLSRIAKLADATRVFCTHEYTAANVAFARTVDPHNVALANYASVVNELRAKGQISLPSTIGLEKAINPFLRCDKTEIRQAVERQVDKKCADPIAVFRYLRQWKDKF